VQGAHAANPAHERVVDHLRECHGDRGIERIAAPGKNRRANIGGTRLWANDNAFYGDIFLSCIMKVE
jgi:hypothetical protein